MSFKKILLAVGLIGFITGIWGYIHFFSNNTKLSNDKEYIFIPTGSTFAQVEKILSPYIENINQFKSVAKLRSYDKNVFPGRFLLKKGMGSFQIVTALRHNEPLNLAFNNQERIENLVSRIANQIEADSISLIKCLQDSTFMQQNGFANENILTMFVPNTYEVKWNISPEKFREKMFNEYQKFWTSERLNKAKALNLTPQQVGALASIVHKETVKTDERPRVAGVYLNRLKIEMPLQADPTIIFAVKKQTGDYNQVIKRVRGEMLYIKSPYNTYTQKGLPPGPVAMPDISAIDAVLNPEKHDYIYFCANTNGSGYHQFAKNYDEHMVNAKKYAEWVNKLGITK